MARSGFTNFQRFMRNNMAEIIDLDGITEDLGNLLKDDDDPIPKNLFKQPNFMALYQHESPLQFASSQDAIPYENTAPWNGTFQVPEKTQESYETSYNGARNISSKSEHGFPNDHPLTSQISQQSEQIVSLGTPSNASQSSDCTSQYPYEDPAAIAARKAQDFALYGGPFVSLTNSELMPSFAVSYEDSGATWQTSSQSPDPMVSYEGSIEDSNPWNTFENPDPMACYGVPYYTTASPPYRSRTIPAQLLTAMEKRNERYAIWDYVTHGLFSPITNTVPPGRVITKQTSTSPGGYKKSHGTMELLSLNAMDVMMPQVGNRNFYKKYPRRSQKDFTVVPKLNVSYDDTEKIDLRSINIGPPSLYYSEQKNIFLTFRKSLTVLANLATQREKVHVPNVPMPKIESFVYQKSGYCFKPQLIYLIKTAKIERDYISLFFKMTETVCINNVSSYKAQGGIQTNNLTAAINRLITIKNFKVIKTDGSLEISEYAGEVKLIREALEFFICTVQNLTSAIWSHQYYLGKFKP